MTETNSGPAPVAAPGDPALRRVHVVVDLQAPPDGAAGGLEAVAEAVAAQLPWPRLPAMTDSASRDAAVVAADDSRSLEVVLLLEARTEEEAEEEAVSVVREALEGAGLSPESASPSQVVVRDAYLP
ncbi:hypothetical protein FHN55_19875 [Streptomyces sp. NP160]|uniref:hypothetical protein n=1 Tax=Streptomyces sp. NP160 TaxID=2586637 RepID=UPI001119DCF0|nr:hypothetical protein [Streptomyces sp. NP160]TNM60046.1 hypothetical protein FHN55_19875 [Streptomyces sp. NP160]